MMERMKENSKRMEEKLEENNKKIVNDRTSPGEIEEILKRFHGCLLYTSRCV